MPYQVDEEAKQIKMQSDKWIRPEEMIDTTKLQLKSLTEFAKGLGYDFYYPIDKRFMSNDFYGNKGKEFISFSTMVKLHNNHYQDWHGGDRFKSPFRFNTYKIRKARAGKIIHKVNLQMDKRTGYIRATSSIVSFCFIEYEGFLDEQKYL